jgi:hypothetical protein
MSSCLGFFQFMVCAISAISMRPSVDLCRPMEISFTQRANFSKFCCFGLRNGCALKNGMTVSSRSERRLTASGACSLGGCHTVDFEQCLRRRRTHGGSRDTRRLRRLRDRELVRDLETSLVASPPRTVCLPHEADREASFSVYKTDHPATELDQPFLLVFRTRHIVTLGA